MFSFDSKDSPHMCFGPSRVEQNRFNCLVLAFHVCCLSCCVQSWSMSSRSSWPRKCTTASSGQRYCAFAGSVPLCCTCWSSLCARPVDVWGTIGSACIRRWSTMSTNFGAAPFAFWRRRWTAVPRPTGAFGGVWRPGKTGSSHHAGNVCCLAIESPFS